MSFHIFFLDFLSHLILYLYIYIFYASSYVIALLPAACSFIKSHDAYPLLSLSGTHIWSLCALSLYPLTLPLRTTPGERCSVLALQSGKSPVLSPRLAKWEGHEVQQALTPLAQYNTSPLQNYYLIQRYSSLMHHIWPDVFCFQITYYNQATPGVLPYISTDIAGLSSSFYSAFSACSHFLETNKDSLAALPPSALWHNTAAMVSLQKEEGGMTITSVTSSHFTSVVEVLCCWRSHSWMQVSDYEITDVCAMVL